jgi:hypothetical protein
MTESNGQSPPEPLRVNLGEALGANAGIAVQCFTVYIPNKDKTGKEMGNQRQWVLEAIDLMTRLNGGATAMPVEGAWRDEHGSAVWEHPVVVYSFIKPAVFFANLPAVREFLHRMGRETNQGEVAFEFDDRFYLISHYDSSAQGNGP